MFKSLWHYVKKSLFGNKPPEKPNFRVYLEVTKPDPNYKPPPKEPKPPKPIPEQPPLKCPYCGHLFDKISGSKRKCPNCKSEIIVRTDNKVKLLFTPEGAEKFDAERQRKYNRNNLIREYLGEIDGETFDTQKTALESITGQSVSNEQFTLHLLNEGLKSKEIQDDLISQKLQYLAIANLQDVMGLDPYDAKAALFRCDLLYDAQQYGYDAKVKVHASCKCENCSKVDGKVMTIQEALVKMPLPVRGCEMDVFARYNGYVEDEG